MRDPSEPNHALELIREISLQQLPCVVILDAGSTALGKQFNRLELRIAHTTTCVLALTSKLSRQAQVVVEFKRLAWLYTEKQLTGYRVQANLAKHPTVSVKQTEFELQFEAGGTDA